MLELPLYYLLRLLASLAQRLPLELVLYLGELIGIGTYYIVTDKKRIALKNLRAALGKEYNEHQLKHIFREMARNLGRSMMEFLRFPAMTPKDIEQHIKFTGLEHLEKARAQGKGVFILTAHFGNWELYARALVFKGYPLNIVTKHLINRVLNRFWLDYRRRAKVNALYWKGSLAEIVRRLRNNELMGFVLDQNTKRKEGVFVNFFGRPACTIPSLATLAQRLGTPVVPGFIIRENKAYHRIVFEPPLVFQKRGTLNETIVHNTQIYTGVIERYIRAYPDHWAWVHRRWKTKPLREKV